jgi:hypothetical protein
MRITQRTAVQNHSPLLRLEEHAPTNLSRCSPSLAPCSATLDFSHRTIRLVQFSSVGIRKLQKKLSHRFIWSQIYGRPFRPLATSCPPCRSLRTVVCCPWQFHRLVVLKTCLGCVWRISLSLLMTSCEYPLPPFVSTTTSTSKKKTHFMESAVKSHQTHTLRVIRSCAGKTSK